VDHEQLMVHVHECYRQYGVKLYEVQQEGVELSKAPPPALIYHDMHADLLWGQVQVQLENR
jgi:hypothetical protein